MATFNNNNPEPLTPTYTLYMSVNQEDLSLIQYYEEAIESHNNEILHNPMPDSGFDLIVPEEQELYAHKVNKINFQVKCEMRHNETHRTSPFYMYPRSSISKSHFRLANNTGIIDSGYRGCLMGMFDLVYTQQCVKCEKHCRLLQVCAPNLEPFKVVLLQNDNAMSQSTRGEGGFGSTGGISLPHV